MRGLRPLHVALLIPWMVALVAARLPLRDNSFLWHVRAGTIQIESGSVLTSDPFSFTFGGEPWRTQSWLIELLYGWLEQRIGISMYTWIVAACAVLFAVGVGLVIWRESHSLLATAILLAATSWIMSPFMNPRPVIASYLLFVVVLLVSQNGRLRWTLMPLVWMWASVHASYVLGIALVVVLRLRDREFKKAIEDGAGLLLVSFLTAHGWGAIDFLVGFFANRGALALLTEWATPNFLSIAFLPVVGLLMMAMVAALRQRLEPRQLFVMLVGLVVLFSASRSVLIGWLILIPIASRALGRSDDERLLPRESDGPGLVGLALGVMLLVIPAIVPLGSGFQEERFPVQASGSIQRDRATFHDDVSGGFLAYSMGPSFKIFADDRAELYGQDFFQELLHARSGAPVWRAVFEEYAISQALLRKGDGLVEVLRSEGWTSTFAGHEFVVLVDEDPLLGVR